MSNIKHRTSNIKHRTPCGECNELSSLSQVQDSHDVSRKRKLLRKKRKTPKKPLPFPRMCETNFEMHSSIKLHD